MKKIQARKDQKQESRESIRRPIDPYEAFITGAELSHRMSIKKMRLMRKQGFSFLH
uniref:Uncharacterized protein n=1 Tax=Klebsiella pneumoniae TaxID=573 RepID=A0A8B0SWC8_KLEPN|nr:hypothetical protein [Klebsiella pneumoniae]